MVPSKFCLLKLVPRSQFKYKLKDAVVGSGCYVTEVVTRRDTTRCAMITQ